MGGLPWGAAVGGRSGGVVVRWRGWVAGGRRIFGQPVNEGGAPETVCPVVFRRPILTTYLPTYLSIPPHGGGDEFILIIII